jgi:hypothetical protein
MARDITLGPGSQKLPTGNRHEIMLPPEVWPPLRIALTISGL